MSERAPASFILIFSPSEPENTTAVDISPEMVRQFRAKHPEARVIEADYEKPIRFPLSFDAIMIFNAFPHFRNEETIFRLSHSYLVPGGRLLLCHSMSREALNEHHHNAGGVVSEDVLISDERIAGLYRKAGFAAVRVETHGFLLFRRNEMSVELRDVSLAAVFGAAALALPVVFHALGLGPAFLPMFLPLSAAGFLLPFRVSGPLAVVVPAVSFVLTGMPPMTIPPTGPIMMIELAFLMAANRTLHTRLKLNIFLAAAIATLAERGFYLALLFLAATVLRLPRIAFSLAALVRSLPGTILLISAIPAIVLSVRKHRIS